MPEDRPPFTVDSGDSRLFLNPGPWGVVITVDRYEWDAPGPAVASITLSAEDATRLAAALVLAAAYATSYQETTPEINAEETVSEPI